MNKNFIEQLNNLHENSEHDKIIQIIEGLSKSELNYDLKNLLGRAYNNESKYDKALEVLLPESLKGNDDALWNFRVGYAYFYKHEEENALLYFKKSKELGDTLAEDFIQDCIRDIENKNNPKDENKQINQNISKMTLNKIAWTFSSQFYTDSEEFDKEVTQYQMDIYKTDEQWKPNEIVFDFPELQIQYVAWVKGASDLLENETLIEEDKDVFGDEPHEDDMYQVEVVATLKADNAKNFTALEFLMKSHNQQANKELGDHVFFEGTDENPEIIDGLPLCYIACGS